MKKRKGFDCVEMKWKIQRKLMQEHEGMTLSQRQAEMERTILADPVLGPWFRQLKNRQAQPMMAAESPAIYRTTRRTCGKQKHD